MTFYMYFELSFLLSQILLILSHRDYMSAITAYPYAVGVADDRSITSRLCFGAFVSVARFYGFVTFLFHSHLLFLALALKLLTLNFIESIVDK